MANSMRYNPGITLEVAGIALESQVKDRNVVDSGLTKAHLQTLYMWLNSAILGNYQWHNVHPLLVCSAA